MSRPRGLSLLEALVAITLLSVLVLSVLSVFAAATRGREHAEQHAAASLALSHELSRAWADPRRFLIPEARGAWVRETELPPEYVDRLVDWQWGPDPSGIPDLAVVRVRVSWRERTSLGDGGLRDVSRTLEGSLLVERP